MFINRNGVKKDPKPFMTDKERKAFAGFLRGTLAPDPAPSEVPNTELDRPKKKS